VKTVFLRSRIIKLIKYTISNIRLTRIINQCFLTAIIWLLFLGSFNVSYAQIGKPTFGIHAGYSMPIGDFGDVNGLVNKNAAFASNGMIIGIDIGLPLKSTGFSIISSGNYLSNAFDRDEFEKDIVSQLEFGNSSFNNLELNSGKWISIPVMSGLNWCRKLWHRTEVYIQGQMGINWIRPPDLKLMIDGVVLEQKFDWGRSFVIGGGAGIALSKINLGFIYFNSKDVEFTVTMITPGLPDEEDQVKLPVINWAVIIGFEF